jgi:hypothetical protein
MIVLRHRRLALLLLALLAAALTVALERPQRSSAVTGPATIRVVTRQIESAVIDNGRRGESPGDLMLATALVYNTRVTPRSIGQFELRCTTIRGESRFCDGVIHLPKGDVVVGGTIRHMPLYELAVVGGTGLYDNARGTLTVTRLGTKPTRELLLVRLVG